MIPYFENNPVQRSAENKVYLVSCILFNKLFNVDNKLCLILLLLLLLLNVIAFAIS